jgi:hypothetical protein
MNIEINILTVLEKDLNNVSERKTAHLATLKSKKYINKLIAFLKTLQRLKQEWQKSPALGPGKQTAKMWFSFGEIRRKKISQMLINAYLYLPIFLLIILWQQGTSHPNLLFVKKKKVGERLFFVVDRQ